MTPSDILTILASAFLPRSSLRLRVTLLTPRLRGRKVRLRRSEGLRGSPWVAVWRFDLDDFGAHVGEDLTGERAGDEVAELDDFDAFERSFLSGAVLVGSVLRWVLRHDDANITPKVVDGWCGAAMPHRPFIPCPLTLALSHGGDLCTTNVIPA